MSKNKTIPFNAEELEAIIALLPGHIYWEDLNCVIQGGNDNQAHFAGFESRYDLVGKTDHEMPWKEHADNIISTNKQVMSSGTSVTLEEEIFLPNGDRKIFLSTKLPRMDNQGKVVGLLGISIDITDRKEMEEELKFSKKQLEVANKAKTEFIENMRHDFITPLSGIIGFSDILLSKTNDKEIIEHVNNLKESGTAFLRVLKDVFERINIITGQDSPVEDRKFELMDIVENIIDLHKVKAKEKSIKLIHNFDDELPKYLIGDLRRVHRILFELVNNAIKFTKSGYVLIEAKFHEQKDREVILRLQIEDTGIGIPEDEQSKVYIAFKKMTPSYRTPYSGIGMGLTIVKKYIEDLEGEIYLTSKPDSGTCITCYLPFRVALSGAEVGLESPAEYLLDNIYHDEDRIVEIEPESISSQDILKSRVLIVEDNTMAAKLAKSILEELNCHVDIALDGKEAISSFDNHHYEIIFMDIGLPDMDGMRVTQLIREKEKKNNIKEPTPIFALTAHKDNESFQDCINVGMYGILEKPLNTAKAQDLLLSFSRGLVKPSVESDGGEFIEGTDDEAYWLINDSDIIDIVELQKIFKDEDVRIECIGHFVSELKHNLLSELSDLYALNDWERIRELSLLINGSACYCAAKRLRDASYKLEVYIRKGRKPLRTRLYENFIEEIKFLIEESKSLSLS